MPCGVHMRTCSHVSAREGQKLVLGVFFSGSPPYFLSQSRSLNLEVMDLTRLAGVIMAQVPYVSPSTLEITGVCSQPA